MSDDTIWLSICIPTYNRGEYLRQTLKSIVEQKDFQQSFDIEIVISDNCSTDNTHEVGMHFASNFPGKVRYHRNAINEGPESNFEGVLRKGKGRFLKLHNDNLLIRNGSLTEIVKVIKATALERPVIFFTNGNKSTGKPLEICHTFNNFVKTVSFFSTWIGGFGIWREDLEAIPDFSVNAHLRIIQTDIVFRLVAAGRRAIVLLDVYFVGMDIGKKGGYNIAEVFGQNYLSLLKKYVSTGLLSAEVYEQEKKDVLLRHIIPYYFDETNGFDKTGFFKYMRDYENDDYFLAAIESLIFQKQNRLQPTQAPTPSQDDLLREYWRQRNSHNETILTKAYGPVNFENIKVGRKTYGGITVWSYGNPSEALSIGSFVSIADDVTFLLGGNHGYSGLSTFPFLTKYFGTLESQTKGPVSVGDDVWIGYNTLILSGVTIGQGAVIAAGSVVSKDVLPYSIVGGNPARLIRYRFERAVIDKLLSVDFEKLTDAKILSNKTALQEPLTSENVEAVLTALGIA